ncbi:primosomal protein N' [Fructilactobacillus lindneri]|uniref:primosomal protein N' n=1 Tax=Fructilactobacillus lindneri TaxID=53444 RepID=UPI000CD3BAA7|nr:primosomal protein N' [Fructilactobacillus lindneri]POG98672.1 primosomal protein N' [Fructilactobacillus lindneri]
MNVADVIVDVPTMQTNTPYSYLIPDDLKGRLETGMRVVVPFGNGNRKVEGFVVGIGNLAQDKTTTLKSISSIMDLSPVLNNELIKLSSWMANKTYSFQISCLLTMLPSVMKAEYSSTVELIGEIDDKSLANRFKKQQVIPFDEDHFSKAEMAKLSDLKKRNQIKMTYHVQNKAKPKTELAILNQIIDFAEVTQEISKNATAQIKLLKLLQKFPDQPLIQRKIVNENAISISAINNFVKKGFVKKIRVEKYRNPYKHQIVLNKPKKLNSDQQIAVNKVDRAIAQHHDRVFLLEGVTGSGKTEVYLQTIQHAINDKRQALMLVPEIALTPQMVGRVKNRFGSQVAIIHSGLSNGEKYDEWRRINQGEAQVVVGARSAIFAPLKNIGLIILDEEHDASYKQDDNPRYHTRDVAIWRAAYHHCPVILGSATPSLESRARAEKGVYDLILLPNRINQQSLPQVTIVDMTQEIEKHGDIFSTELLNDLKQTINQGNQVVLMLNRRGFSSFMLCRDCGHVLMCPNCDISLTMHLDSHTMKCHYCGFEEAIPNICPVCHSKNIRYFGTGTERAAQQLEKLIPEAKILRMDVDTTKRKGAHENILRKFGNHEANVLLGTQMIAKGLDFPDVTLVGVLNADTGLDLPDFRASERTFDLLTQVSGRAGRSDKNGKVIIQTFNPDNYAIKLASTQNYEKFFQKEMELRHLADYAPYYFTIKVTISSLSEHQAAKEAYQVSNYLKGNLEKDTIILGPTPRPIARVKSRYYYQIIIKYKRDQNLDQALKHVQQVSQKEIRKGLRIAIDPEPVNFM